MKTLKFAWCLFIIFLLINLKPNVVVAQWQAVYGYQLTYHPITGNTFTVTSTDKILAVTDWDGYSPHDYGSVIAASTNNGESWYVEGSQTAKSVNFINGQKNGLVMRHIWDPTNGTYIHVSLDDGVSYGNSLSGTGDGSFVASEMIDSLTGLALHTYNNPAKTLNQPDRFDWPPGYIIRYINGVEEEIPAFGVQFRFGSLKIVNDTTAYLLCKSTSSNYLLEGNDFLLKTTDFGISWDTILHNNETRLKHMAFASPDEGMVGSNNGVFYYTTDGGQTFSTDTADYRSINHIITKNGSYYAVGNSGLILKKETFDSPWIDLSYLSSNYEKICLNSEMVAFIMSDFGQLYKSTEPVSTKQFESKLKMHVYPNPAKDHIIFEAPVPLNQKFTLKLFEINGKMIYENEFKAEAFPVRINTSDFSPGLYIYSGTSGRLIFSGKLSLSH